MYEGEVRVRAGMPRARRVASRRVCLRALELRRVTSPSFLTSMYLTFGSLLRNSVHQSGMLPTVTPPEALQGLPEDQAHVAIRVSQMYRTAADASSYTSLGGAEGWLICWSHFCPCRMCVISWEYKVASNRRHSYDCHTASSSS